MWSIEKQNLVYVEALVSESDSSPKVDVAMMDLLCKGK